MTFPAVLGPQRTPAQRKARHLAKYLRGERPDYAYLKEVFRHLRAELDIEVTRAPKKLPYVPTEAEIRAFYHAVWKARRASDVVLIKTLLYTGVRVAKLARIRIADVDLDACRIRITQGNGGKDRVVSLPPAFKETLAQHIDAQRRAGAAHLFESSWKNAGRRHRLVRHGWPQCRVGTHRPALPPTRLPSARLPSARRRSAGRSSRHAPGFAAPGYAVLVSGLEPPDG